MAPTTATTRRRRRRAAAAPSAAAWLLLLLTSPQHTQRASSLLLPSNSRSASMSMISSRRAPAWGVTRSNSTSLAQSYNQKAGVATGEGVVELQYSEFLPPSKGTGHPPVIFLHGLLGNKRNFASLASSLSTQLQNPRTIYTLDLRNHGENTHDWRSTMSYSEMSRDVLAFMDKLPELNNHGGKHEKAVIVGHSMGGKVAQSLALMHPERVEGLVVLDIAPVRYRSDRNDDGTKGDGSGWTAVEDIVRSVASIDLGEEAYKTKRDVDAVLRKGMLEDPALRAFVLTNLEQARTTDEGGPPLRWKINWNGIVAQLDRIAGFDVNDENMDESVDTEYIEQSSGVRYDGDAFFIHGGASRFVRHSHLPQIGTFFPNHMLTTIRGVGHWVHAEAPDDTVALLKRYLDR
ncbi:hypothetical protein ACHAXT_012174 [Thalassiosira profunda]